MLFRFDCDWDFNCDCDCNFDLDLDCNRNGWYLIEDGRFSFDRDGMRSVVMNQSHQFYHSSEETLIRTDTVLGGCILIDK